jgi:hypothetical protein
LTRCVPIDSDDVLHVATGAAATLPARQTIVAAPSLNAIVPPATAGMTVAVSVIGTPKSDGALLELTTTVDALAVTLIVTFAVAGL